MSFDVELLVGVCAGQVRRLGTFGLPRLRLSDLSPEGEQLDSSVMRWPKPAVSRGRSARGVASDPVSSRSSPQVVSLASERHVSVLSHRASFGVRTEAQASKASLRLGGSRSCRVGEGVPSFLSENRSPHAVQRGIASGLSHLLLAEARRGVGPPLVTASRAGRRGD
jgi:hypothetical protein